MARNRRSLQYRRPLYEVTSAYSPRYGNPHLKPRRSSASSMWMWGCLGLMSLMCVGICILTLVLTPIAFRMLPEDFQARIIRRLPFLGSPTETPDRSLEVMPTVDPARAAAAAALLGTPLPVGTATPVLGYVPQSPISTTPNGIVVVGATATPPPGQSGPASLQMQAPIPARPTATSMPLPAQFRAEQVKREPQTWNNCGPANLVQGLRALGVEVKQANVAGWLKPNKNDANVSPWQMAYYTNQFTQTRAVVRHNGSLELLKRLVFAGFGAIIETGLYDHEDGSWLGHYLTVVGWDDLGDGQGGFLYGLDSLEDNGPGNLGVHEYYADLDERWKHFNRVYMVIYKTQDENMVRDILGTSWDERENAAEALGRATQEAQANPNDVFAWFNMGTNYVLLGQWQAAAVAYDRARSVGKGLPWRMLWYQFGPYVAYYKVGDYKTVLDLANAVLNRVKYVEETFYYRALAYIALGQRDAALADLQYAARFNPNFNPAQTALVQLQSGVSPAPEVL